MASRTVYDLLAGAAERFGDRPALHQPFTKAGKRNVITYSWGDYKQAVDEIAAGLHTLGLRKGDVVALNSETRLEFYLCDIAIMATGAVAAAMYPSYPPEDLKRTLRACRARAVFVEDAKTLTALRQESAEHWIVMTGSAPGSTSLEDLREQGRRALAADGDLVRRLNSGVTSTDAAILYLTSGATAEPKMALVSHHALLSNVEMGPAALPLTPEDVTVVFLPSAHIAQRLVMELLPIPSGTPVTFAESLMKLPQEIKSTRPTVFLAPPRMWERIYSTICAEIRKRPAPVRKMFYGAVGVGAAAARMRREGKAVPAHLRLLLKAADLLVFRKIRERFGGRIRVAASGAAPLSRELAEFYESIGMPLVEGYGLTEGGVVTFNPLDCPRPGSIGKPLPGVEVKIATDGELVVKSPTLFFGYFDDPAGTAAVLRDGWLYTGDVGYRDSDGFLYVSGRKKDLIVSSTGKKIYPARVESLLKVDPLISHVLLIGDKLPYLVALITINPAVAETLDGMEEYRNGHGGDIAEAPAVAKEVQKAIGHANRQLAPFEQVRKFRILSRDFTIQDGELTATMKVRRTRVLQNFQQQVEELYEGRDVQ